MMKNSHEFSIFGNTAEKCCSNIGFGECAYCNKKGLPVLLTRYSVRSSKNLKLCDMKSSELVANAMPWDLKCLRSVDIRNLESKNDKLQENYTPHLLDQSVEYILRRPRQGYVYIYDEMAYGNWCCYSINRNGYVRAETLNRPMPLDELPDFKCTEDASHIAMGSIITLPYSEASRTVYLCYVEAVWSKEWRNKISADPAWRKEHMQKVVVGKKLSGLDVYSLEELENIVLDFSNDDYLMNDDPDYNVLNKVACFFPKNKASIAQFVKETLCNHSKEKRLSAPAILALQDDIAITLHLNELRVAPHTELDELTKRDTTHRPYLWAASVMALEQALQQSPYVSMVYDPSINDCHNHKDGSGWKYSKLKSVPDDYCQSHIAHGASYKDIKEKDDKQKERGKKEEEELNKNHHFLYKFLIEPQANSVHGAVYISPRQELEFSWYEKGRAQERLLAEFYENKYYDFSKYKKLKNELREIQQRIDTESERTDLDYCWWLENRLPKALACYDPNDQVHKTVVTSLLSRALVGGIVGQSSRNLWQKFHKNPENYPMIISGILGWNNELSDCLTNSLSSDYAGPVDKKLKHKTLFEELYIKEIGKLIKKGHSFAKGFHEFIDKDFSLKALNALKERHQKVQLIADTVESTHKTLLLDMQYLSGQGVAESFSQETAFIEKHSSGLRVAQFKMLRIMFVSKIVTGDLIARIRAISETRQQNYSLEQKKIYLEAQYAKKSAELTSCKDAVRHLTFIEMPINEVQQEIKRISLRRLSNKMSAMGMPTPDVNPKNIQESSIDDHGNKKIVGNTYNINSGGSAVLEFPVLYSDDDSLAIKKAADEIERSMSFDNTEENIATDNKMTRQRWMRVVFDHYNDAVNSPFANRWVGRISRVAIYWGFVDSFCRVMKSPGDLKAWWKMSGSVISVTQAYFDTWEMAATDQINILEKAKASEYLLEKELLIADDAMSALTKELNFAKLWSKRLGVITSIISIIDGFKELGHAVHMREHGELPSDVSAITKKGFIGIASGVVGILLIETAVFGGILVILAFAIALWLLPSTENLMPLGIRNWLRRSQYGHKEGLNYLPFNGWQDEQSSFEMVLKGIEVDVGVHYCSANEMADQSDKIDYNIDVEVSFPEELIGNIAIFFKGYNNKTKSFFNIFNYNEKESAGMFYEIARMSIKDSWYRVDFSTLENKNGFGKVGFTMKKRTPSMLEIYCYELLIVFDGDNGVSKDSYTIGVYR